jgi:hypothetical protein
MSFEQLLEFELNGKYPIFINDVPAAIEKVRHYMSPKFLDEYVDTYNSSKDLFGDSIRFTPPVELLIAGNNLISLEVTQNKYVVDKVKKKFKQIRLVDSQLSDLLAEVFVAEIFGLEYEIILDHPTGIKTNNGSKDGDIYIPKLGVYIEVKNYQFGKSKAQKQLGNITNKLFSNPNSAGKQFQIEKSKGRPNIVQIGTQNNGSSISMHSHTPLPQYKQMIRSAEGKFSDAHKAILVLTGVYVLPAAIKAVQDWHTPKIKENPIKSVVIFERLQAETYKRTLSLIELEDDDIIDGTLKSTGLNLS